MLRHKIYQKPQHIIISQKSQNTSSQTCFSTKSQNAIHPPVYLFQSQITDFGSRNLHTTLSSDLFFSDWSNLSSIIRVIKSRMMGWQGKCVAHEGDLGVDEANLILRNRKWRCGQESPCSGRASMNTVTHLRIPQRHELSWPSAWLFSWEGPCCMLLATSYYNL